MFDYLKTLYRSMKYAGYYTGTNEPTRHLRDEFTLLMGDRS